MKSIKKLLAVVMAIALIATYFVLPASAATTIYDVSVAGTQVTSDNANNVRDDTGTATVSYDPSNNILTLNNANINTREQRVIISDRNKDLIIEVKGTCTISTDANDACGIYNNTSGVTIKGTGTLKIDMSNSASTGYNIYGILNATEDGGVTICDSATLEIVTPDLGISTYKNIIVKDSATLKVTASSTAISGSDITISDDANVDITSGNYGIDGKNVTIEDNAIVNVTSGIAAIYAYDTINFNGKINVNCLNKGTNIDSFYGDAKDNAGVLAKKDIYFNLDDGGQVTAETKCTCDGYDAAFLVSSFDTITLNTKDGTKVILPVDGKASEVSVGWAITEADGTTYAKKATVKNEYKIKESADEAVWTKGSTTGQKITSTADFSKFVSVSVDGKVVDAANYDKAEGSTIITFKPAFLETLSVGKHPVVITSKNGTATGTLTIKEVVTPTPETKEETKATEVEAVADTADTNAIGAFVALSAFAAAGFVSLKKKEN